MTRGDLRLRLWSLAGLLLGMTVVAGALLPPSAQPVVRPAVALVLILSVLLSRPSAFPRLPSGAGLLGALLLLGVGSLAWSVDPAATRRASVHLGGEAILILTLTLWPLPGQAWRVAMRVAGLMFVGATLLVVLSALGIAGEALPEVIEQGRVALPWRHPTLLARVAALVVLLLLLFERGPLVGVDGLKTPALALLLLPPAALAGLSGSRGALLALLLALVYLARKEPREDAESRGTRATPRRGWALAVAVVSLAAYAGTGQLPGHRAPLAGLDGEDREAVTSGRDAIWANVGDIIAEHPLAGVGLAAVPAAYDEHRDRRMAEGGLRSKPSRDPHSLYLQLLAGLGPLGLLLFLLAMHAGWRAASASPFSTEARALILFAGLSAATQSTLELKDFWLALGLGLLLASRRKE